MRVVILLMVVLLAQACAKRPLYRTVTIEDVEYLKNHSGDTLFVINFWATWCQPCREEMPAFERISKEFAPGQVKVMLVSVDEERFVKSDLRPFLKKRNLKSEVLWLDAPNPAYWIDKVHADWGGNIPVTLLVLSSKGIVELHDHQLSYEELAAHIKRLNDDP